MLKYYYLNAFLFFSFSITAQTTIVKQSFETSGDTWSYETSVPPCTSGNDIWNIVENIETITPSEGIHFWGIRDLNGDCGSSDFENIAFSETDISDLRDVTLSMDYQIFEFDNGDDLKYELFYDGVSQGEVVFFEGNSNKSTNGWVTLHIDIPNRVTKFKFVLYIKQNGDSDYAGIDNIKLTGSTYIPCSELMISEYVEGTSSNKFLELYNPTGDQIDLGNYHLTRFVGKDTVSTGDLNLTGNIPAYGTFLIENNNEDLGVNSDLSTGSIVSFNGDDKIALKKNDEIIDLIGVIGDSLYFAKDVTLRRKSSVQSPNNEFTPEEWDIYETNDISNLNKHVSLCSGPIPEIEVFGNYHSVTDGSSKSDILNGTWFGFIPIESDSVINQTFTIKNTGNKVLNIYSVSITGSDSDMFTLGENLNMGLNENDSISFSIAFTPSSKGLKTAKVNISNDDASENPVDFIIQAEATGTTENPVIISQYYKGEGNNKWIEVSNISNSTIPAETYFISLYQTDKIRNPQNTKPSYSKSIPEMAPGETIKFRPSLNVNLPEYALDGSSVKSNICFFDADDIIILTTTKDEHSWKNRFDMIWHGGNNISLVRKYGCNFTGASTGFSMDDWLIYSINDINSATADDNIRIGVHHSGATTFINGNWNNGTPDANTNAKIDDKYNTSSLGSFNSCNLTITAKGILSVSSGDYVSIKKNLAVEGALEILHEGSLLMTENEGTISNTGTIRICKTTTELKRYDYTYWSSPIEDAVLEEVFYESPENSFFTFNTFEFIDNNKDELDDDDPQAWQQATGKMIPGTGYTAMAPNKDPFITTQSVEFSGTPNTGIIEIPVKLSEKDTITGNNWNFIGNPYPSAIDANIFLNDSVNKDVLGGCIYLWTHTTAYEGGEYTSDDYAIYSIGTGGICANTNSRIPDKYINSCQGFFVESTKKANIRFSNTMRTETGNNSFFKDDTNKIIPKNNRIWLNLYNDKGAFSQILIGFIEGAQPELERQYDAIRFDGNKYLSFYSLQQNQKLAIMGISPFTGDENISLGLTTKFNKKTKLKINIAKLEGNIKNEKIYLVDKLLQKTHLLNKSDYEFEVTGTEIINDRFELSFKENNSDDQNSTSNQNIILKNTSNYYEIENLGENKIYSLKIYDMVGRIILSKHSMKKKERINKNIFKANGVFILVIKIENERFHTRKLLIAR